MKKFYKFSGLTSNYISKGVSFNFNPYNGSYGISSMISIFLKILNSGKRNKF